MLNRPLKACEDWAGDVEPAAWYGYRCRGLTYIDADEHQHTRRAVYTTATRFFLPGGFGRWDEVLLRVLDATTTSADAQWVQAHNDGHARLHAIGWKDRHPEYRTAMLDYAGERAYAALTAEYVPHGTFRSLARLFRLTDPSQGQIAAWLLLIARTTRQHAPRE